MATICDKSSGKQDHVEILALNSDNSFGPHLELRTGRAIQALVLSYDEIDALKYWCERIIKAGG